jgi:hypothetical protein
MLFRGVSEGVVDLGLSVETLRSGVEAALALSLFFFYRLRFLGIFSSTTSVEVEAGKALDTSVGSAATGRN